MTEVVQTPRVGRFAIVQELQKDRFGILYEAIDETTQQSVLLRVISPEISNAENFIVRFELLKGLLPKIRHDNLVNIIELGQDRNLFFITKERPTQDENQPLITLKEFDPRDTPNRQRTLEALFEGIALGLQALLETRNGYHQEGLLHEVLDPQQIYLKFEKGGIGGYLKPVPQIDHFAEPFLFYGEGAGALAQYRIALASNPDRTLFELEHLYPSRLRRGQQGSMMYSLGALIHQTVGSHQARGLFPSLLEIDPSLDPRWDTIANLCLTTSTENESSQIDTVVKHFREMSKARTQLSPQEQRLRQIVAPEGMALISFEDKIELGAADGPVVEQPRFKAALRPFFIDLTPVTCKQFSAFLTDYRRSTYSSSNTHAATLVSWKIAKAYCDWRSEQENLPRGSYRLPTEYEWEAAARGAHGQQYPWGPELQQHRLHAGQEKEIGSLPVQTMPPGRFGLYDMIGNVWEWTESIFKPHPFSKHHEPGYNTMLRVVKGGCWFTPLNSCRASLRAAFPPQEMRGNIGFRCVRPIDLETDSDNK